MTIRHPSVEEPAKGAKATALARKRRMELRKSLRSSASKPSFPSHHNPISSSSSSSSEASDAEESFSELPKSMRVKREVLEKKQKAKKEKSLQPASFVDGTSRRAGMVITAEEDHDQELEEEAEGESKPKPSITGIKRQHRYDPGVSMTREELKAWRKEARRVRNRESAAASRKRNRERITELEGEVDAIKSKYGAALQWILQLEASACTTNDSFTPKVLRQDLQDAHIEDQQRKRHRTNDSLRPSSPENVLDSIKTVSPPLSPASASSPHPTNPVCINVVPSMSLGHTSHSPPPPPPDQHCHSYWQHSQQQQQQLREGGDGSHTQYQHIMDAISRPAVKISGASTSSENHSPSSSWMTSAAAAATAAAITATGDEVEVSGGITNNTTADTSSREAAFADETTCHEEECFDETELGAFLMDTFEAVDGLGSNHTCTNNSNSCSEGWVILPAWDEMPVGRTA